MRKICLILISLVLCVSDINAAERGQNTVSRQSVTKNEVVSPSRNAQKRTVTSRENSNNLRNQASNRASMNKTVIGRSATQKNITQRVLPKQTRVSRVATTKTFGTNYNSCRDAYFSCMDQFCATLNEDYRRCVCSSKLKIPRLTFSF